MGGSAAAHADVDGDDFGSTNTFDTPCVRRQKKRKKEKKESNYK